MSNDEQREAAWREYRDAIAERRRESGPAPSMPSWADWHAGWYAARPAEHGPDWSDWQEGDDGDSCKCGFNGTSQECATSRSLAAKAEPVQIGREALIEMFRDTRCIATPRLERGFACPIPVEAERMTDAVIAHLAAQPVTGKPETVCICGSTRFRAEMTEANRSLTMQGYIVLAPGVFQHDGDPLTEEDKVRLDKLHFAKIDASDRVHVVNPGGYIGESTRREIDYAESLGKPVTYRVEVS